MSFAQMNGGNSKRRKRSSGFGGSGRPWKGKFSMSGAIPRPGSAQRKRSAGSRPRRRPWSPTVAQRTQSNSLSSRPTSPCRPRTLCPAWTEPGPCPGSWSLSLALRRGYRCRSGGTRSGPGFPGTRSSLIAESGRPTTAGLGIRARRSLGTRTDCRGSCGCFDRWSPASRRTAVSGCRR